MSAEVQSKQKMSKDKKYYINSVIGLAIMFLFGFLPPFDPVTPLGMKYLGIFIGLMWLWSTVDMGWPILAAFAALVTLDCMPLTQIFTSAFANQTVLMCLFCMMVVMPIGDTGIFDYVASWFLKQKFFSGHPWRLTAGLIILVYVAGILHAPIVAIFLVYELVFKICDVAGMKYTHPWTGAVVIGATVAFVYGPAFYPFAGLPLFTFGMLQALSPFQIPFAGYMVFITLAFLIIVAIYMVLMKLMRIDLTPLKEVDTAAFARSLPPMTKYQKQTSIFLIAFIATVIFAGSASSLPSNAITSAFSRLGVVGVSWIFMVILLIWRISGNSAVSLSKMAEKTQWDSILIICVAMSFGPAMAAEGTGISAWLFQITSPIFGGHSPMVFILIISLITLILTNFMNNTVVYMLMVSIIGAYAATMDLNLIVIGGMMMIASQMAFFLPGASYYAALAHGNAVRMGRKNGFVWGAVIAVAAAISLPILYFLGVALF